MTEPTSFRLPFLAKRRHLPKISNEPGGGDYGFIWDGFPMPAGGSCYVVEFEKGSRVSFIAYVDAYGGAYLVNAPVVAAPEGEPDFALVPSDDGRGGGVYVKDAVSKLRFRGLYGGSLRGTMREINGRETWNTRQSLTYRAFMSSMLLRYCVLNDASTRPPVISQSVDLVPRPLGREVNLFAGFQHTSLPDAIDSLLYQIDAEDEPSGIELYTARVLRELDLVRLRSVCAYVPLSLAFIERMRGFFINFNPADISREDIALIYSVEAALNRILQILEVLGYGLKSVPVSPSEEACSVIDQHVLSGITHFVGMVLERSRDANPISCPGTVECEPGGEWDVRTRFAALCESICMVAHFGYDMRCNVQDGTMLVKYVVPVAADMPATLFDQGVGAWRDVDADDRALIARELSSRMALVIAAAAFTSGIRIKTCIIEQVDMSGTVTPRVFEIPRARFMAELVDLAGELDELSLIDPRAARVLDTMVSDDPIPQINPPETAYAPRNDSRDLPADLSGLLLADAAGELEVMETPGEPAMDRYIELRDQAQTDPESALGGLFDLVGELEARSAAAELLSDVPLKSCFCENYLGRVLLPLVVEDSRVRINRVPDALYFAQHEICTIYFNAMDFDRALPEARKLIDIAPTSMQAYFTLVNVLARLGRYDEVIDVCRNGLKLSYDRASSGYLYYRVAFAFWRTGDQEAALACYTMVPSKDEMSDIALEEMRALMAEMGRTDPPTAAQAQLQMRRVNIPVGPEEAVANQVVDAAVRLTDNGFFYLASRCVYFMWRVNACDELNVVHKSLLPQW